MSSTVNHQATVSRIEGNHIWVTIDVVSACATCHAKGACSSMDCAQKEIEVVSSLPLTIGEKVKLTMKVQTGHQAIIFAYILPFIFLSSGLVISSVVGLSEIVSAAIALSSLASYYLLLFASRSFIKKRFQFSIDKNQTPDQIDIN